MTEIKRASVIISPAKCGEVSLVSLWKNIFLTWYVDVLVYEMFEGGFILYPHTKILIFCSSLDIDPSHGAEAKKTNVLFSGEQQSSRKGRKTFAAASSSFWQRGRASDLLRAPWVIWVKCKINHIPGRSGMFGLKKKTGLRTELKVFRSPGSEEEPKKTTRF